MNKILLYTENYLVGGGTKYLIDIVNSIPESYEIFIVSNVGGLNSEDLSFIKRQYNYQPIDVYTFAKIDKKFSKFSKNPSLVYKIFRKIISYILLPLYQRKNLNIFSSLIREVDPTLVFACNGGYPAALSCLDLTNACKKNKKKCILTIVSTPKPKSLVDYFYIGLPDAVNKVIVNSNLAKNVLIKSRDFKSDDIIVVHNSINDCEVGKWNFSKIKGEILLAYVGRIEKNKGSYILLEAFNNICKGRNIRLLMIGTGPELENIKRYAKSLNLDDRVVFTGYLSVNIQTILSVVDIFVFPSFWEGFPYSILEAMNAGKIIISSNVGGIPEAIINKEEGILIQPNNIGELSDAISDVVSNFDKYSYLGVKARQKFDSCFKFNNFKNKIVEIISKINY